jgi:hypothetical protein
MAEAEGATAAGRSGVSGGEGGEGGTPAESRRRWLIKTLAMPTAICVVPLLFEVVLHAHDERSNQLTLYTQLLSQREAADMTVRQAIFDKVLDKYLPPDSKDVDTQLVGLELMADNFHESVDISPLFWQLDRQVMKQSDTPARSDRLSELERIAGVVKSRQVEGLENAGRKTEISLDLDVPPDQQKNFACDWRLPRLTGARGDASMKRHFEVGLVKGDLAGRRLQIQLSYSTPGDTRQVLIWADLYDFPLMNFTRISDEERVAIVLTRLDTESRSATVTLVYYPSSRSGTGDKPYIDDVMSRLGQR